MTKEPGCRCATDGIPDGFVCGKPDCPRTIAANKAVRRMLEIIRDAERAKALPGKE